MRKNLVKAVILAGYDGASKGQLQHKASCMIHNKMMIEYVVQALEKSQCVEKIAVVGDVQNLKPLQGNKRIELVDSHRSLVDNILIGMQRFQGEYILISTSDIPMITAEAVRDFIFQCLTEEADLYYSIIAKNSMLRKYPEARRTYVKLLEGEYTGGNLFFVNSAKVVQYEEIGKKMILYRKKPWKMCKLLGIKFLWKLLTGKLSIADIEQRVYQMMGVKGKAVVSDYPEIGNDVDKPEDLALTKKYMTESI